MPDHPNARGEQLGGRAPRVLVLRAAHQGSALASALGRGGAEAILLPAIELVDPTSFAGLDHAIRELASFDWLLFTSANAVDAVVRRHSGALHAGRRPKIAAIGPSTATALEACGVTADLMPPQAVAESLTAALLPLARQQDGTPTRFLLIRAEEAREHLPDALRAAGAEVTVAAAYKTVIPAKSVQAIRELFRAGRRSPVDAFTFTSASTVRNLFALFEAAGVAFPADVIRASIGPITSASLRECGYPAHVEAPAASVEALATQLIAYLRDEQGGPSPA